LISQINRSNPVWGNKKQGFLQPYFRCSLW